MNKLWLQAKHTSVYCHAAAAQFSLPASTCCSSPAMMGCHSNRIHSYRADLIRQSWSQISSLCHRIAM